MIESYNMRGLSHDRLQHIAKFLACVLIVKVTAGIVLNYDDYLPPDFDSDFLRGREGYFWSGYHWAFYAHILAGPCTLLSGMLLLSERFRLVFSQWHRHLGRIQVVLILLLLVPSGIWMALHAETGPIAGAGFASLAGATGLCVWFGWRAAARRRFAEHRQWMWRCFLLLCSAVLLRLIGGMFTVAGIEAEWTYGLAAWISWLAPLGAFEWVRVVSCCVDQGSQLYAQSPRGGRAHATEFLSKEG